METGKLFSFGLIAVILLACPFTQPSQQAQPAYPPQPPPASQNQNITPANPSANSTLEQQWALITKQNVESACLSSARQEAKAKGYPESVVFSCSCTAQESDGYKSYGCTISALDGSHTLTAACTKSGQSCVIDSEQGTVTYTFDELIAMVG